MEEFIKQVNQIEELTKLILKELFILKQDVRELDNKVENLRKEFYQENEKLRKELRAEFRQENEKLRQELRAEFKQEIREIKDCLFVIEHEHGKKIDAMYDFLSLQNDKLQVKTEEVRRLDKRTERNEIKIFDLEKRVTVLEKCN